MTNPNDLYEQILASGPSPGTLFRLLSKMKEEGRFKRVIQECIRALNVYPYDTPIRKLLAEAYFESGLISQAERELEKVTEQLNVFVSAYKLQAKIFSQQKRDEEAAKTLRLYLSHQPEDQDALSLLEDLTPPEEQPPPMVEAAIPDEGTALTETSTPSFDVDDEEVPEIATPTLAEVYFKQGQTEEAISIYEKVVTQDPEDEFSKHRLDELKSMISSDPAMVEKDLDRIEGKKRRLIDILDTWLTKIRDMSRASVPV